MSKESKYQSIGCFHGTINNMLVPFLSLQTDCWLLEGPPCRKMYNLVQSMNPIHLSIGESFSFNTSVYTLSLDCRIPQRIFNTLPKIPAITPRVPKIFHSTLMRTFPSSVGGPTSGSFLPHDEGKSKSQ